MIDTTQVINYHCSICGWQQKCRPHATMTGKYVAIKCRNCQVEVTYPLPSLEELRRYYSSYHQTQVNEYRNFELVELHQNILDYLLSKIAADQAPSFLDYGFGAGAFLKQVAKNGFPAFGVEFSQQNCEQLQQFCEENNLSINITNLENSSLDTLSDYQFDCITLFQVIEHLSNPLELLTNLASLQSSGGLLYIECPNNNAFYLKIKNLIRHQVGREDFFNSLNPPQHLYGFNSHSLTILLKNAGYTPLVVNDYFFGDGLHQVETLTWYPSFQKFMKEKKRWNFYGTSKFMIGFFDPLVSKLFKSGGGLYALARKK